MADQHHLAPAGRQLQRVEVAAGEALVLLDLRPRAPCRRARRSAWRGPWGWSGRRRASPRAPSGRGRRHGPGARPSWSARAPRRACPRRPRRRRVAAARSLGNTVAAKSAVTSRALSRPLVRSGAVGMIDQVSAAGGPPACAQRVLAARRRLQDRPAGGAGGGAGDAGPRPHRPRRHERRGRALQGLPGRRDQADHRARGLPGRRPEAQPDRRRATSATTSPCWRPTTAASATWSS